jgi:TPR repeat protein
MTERTLIVGAGVLLVGIAALAGDVVTHTRTIGVIDGTVVEVNGEQVVIAGQREAQVGDPVTIFFEIPGFDDLGTAGSGNVITVEGTLVTAVITQRSGDIVVGQLAKIGKVPAGPVMAPKRSASASAAKQPPDVKAPAAADPASATGPLWLGVSMVFLNSAALPHQGSGVSQSSAAVISNVFPGSAGHAAGIRPRDVLLSGNDVAILSLQQLSDLLKPLGPGDLVRLDLMRGGGERLAVSLRLEAAPTDAELFRMIETEAQRGDPAFEHLLGTFYLYGSGNTKKDTTEAVRWLSSSAEHGHQDARLLIAEMALFPQQDTQVNAPEAEAWLRELAEQEQPRAQYLLGELYRTGRIGGAVDHRQALNWFQRSASNGVSPAMTTIGVFYEDGWGVPRDVEQAVAWYRKAAALGEPAAQDNLKRLGR